ncbi:hypothetical protein ACQ86G_09090 [Roseateles chitinivorans]|uniref:hypothetical protein n=1 Tax=Roseateles chitinivorans TaxID=2917965 RepID=UPI003D6783CF
MTRHLFARASGALLSWAIAGGAMAAAGATDVSPPSPARSLSCLQRPEEPPKFPERGNYDRTSGFARVKLRFVAPDRPPEVQLLTNSLREDMLDVVTRHVDRYRLPCLQPTDGTVSAVQEFEFSNTQKAPLPLGPDDTTPRGRLDLCYTRPKQDMIFNVMNAGREVNNIVITMTFAGDGEQPPEVKVLHAEAVPFAVDTVVEWARLSRMSCRKAGEPPVVLQQMFRLYPPGRARKVLKVEQLDLVDFLAMTENPHAEDVRFDFDTMACPFNVNYTMYGPSLPNEVTDGEKKPDRAIFIDWLARQHLKFSSPKQARALFGEDLQIRVPCGRLDLRAKT